VDERCGIDNIQSALAPAVYPRGLDYLNHETDIEFPLHVMAGRKRDKMHAESHVQDRGWSK
jgi:hypothetical protein